MPETQLRLGWPQETSPQLQQAQGSQVHKPHTESFGGRTAEPDTAVGACTQLPHSRAGALGGMLRRAPLHGSAGVRPGLGRQASRCLCQAGE